MPDEIWIRLVIALFVVAYLVGIVAIFLIVLGITLRIVFFVVLFPYRSWTKLYQENKKIGKGLDEAKEKRVGKEADE